MNYATVKNNNVSISIITLGTWAIGGNHWGPCDESKAARMIETALDMGVNAIDTAPVYGDGHSEELIGKVIENKRDRVFLASKCGLDIYTNKYERNLSPAHIETDLAGSLKRLKTDYIDLYQCHWPDPKTPVGETMAALLHHQKQGKIRYIGVSNFNECQLREAIKYTPIFSLQAHYSLLERSIETNILPLCHEHNINVFSYGSLGAGILTGKYREHPEFPKSDARSFFYRFFKKKYWPAVHRLVDTLEELAHAKGTSTGAIALSWLIKQQNVLSVIAGARFPEQVVENITDIPVELGKHDMEILDNLSKDVYKT